MLRKALSSSSFSAGEWVAYSLECAILKLHSDLFPAGLYSIWYHSKTFSFMPAQYSDFALALFLRPWDFPFLF